jgi:hypothetical protein
MRSPQIRLLDIPGLAVDFGGQVQLPLAAEGKWRRLHWAGLIPWHLRIELTTDRRLG